MQATTILSNICATFLEEKTDVLSLEKAIEAYRNLVQTLTKIEVEDAQNKAHLFVDGTAIGTTWAGHCLNDSIRTKNFVKGIATALAELRAKRAGPVQIVYAGTGPYATLILPLLTLYTPEDLQLTLIEINAESFRLVQRLFSQLGFTSFVRRFECTNAITYQLDEELKVDLIISETMQSGLREEHQVPIMMNLLSQIDHEVIIIPAQIELKLGALRYDQYGCLEAGYQSLGSLLVLNVTTICGFIAKRALGITEKIFPEVVLKIATNKYPNHLLAICTEIQIYQEDRIGYRQSGLTCPLPIKYLAADKQHPLQIKAQYQVNPRPELHYQLTK